MKKITSENFLDKNNVLTAFSILSVSVIVFAGELDALEQVVNNTFEE